MGCGFSRFEAPIRRHVRTTRINPRFHRRHIEEIKRRRRPRPRSLKRITPSHKQLLGHRSYEDAGEYITHFNPLFEGTGKSTYSPEEDNESYVTSEGSKKPSEKVEPFIGNARDEKVEKGTDDQNDNAEDGTGDDERRIGNKEGVFPGSPSFRIYYVENAVDDQNETDNENQQHKESTCHIQNAAQNELAVTLKDSAKMAENKGRKRRGLSNAKKGRKIR